MFEQTFKNIDDVLYKDAGADSELDYIEQTSWVLFLRYLDQLDKDRADEAELKGETYEYILAPEYQWSNWAMPLNEKGEPDLNAATTGPDLVEFVDGKLFPYLRTFKQKALDQLDTIEYKIGEIFGELENKIRSGYNLREVINLAHSLTFSSQTQKHELSHLYETKIKNMGNAGRNGGQYYTPRPLIRAMIHVLNPKIGERIYDGAAGSAGFLCEAFDYLKERMEETTANLETLKTKTLYGCEKKNLAYVIGVMNMILHGIDAPNIQHVNTLSLNLNDVQDKNRYDVILANPPFGGKERPEVQENFEIRTGETAFLFLQHFIKMLKAGGRAAIVIKNTFLSNTDNASIALRKLLLESCDLHTVLDMPAGTFTGAGVKTVVLFFTKGQPTGKIWYYQLQAGRSLGKTNPLNDDDMQDFIKLSLSKSESLSKSDPSARLSLSKSESQSKSDSSVRLSLSKSDEETNPDPSVRLSLSKAEGLSKSDPSARLSLSKSDEETNPERSVRLSLSKSDSPVRLSLSKPEGGQESGETENSWTIDIADIPTDTYDLSVKNPNAPQEAPLPTPQEILAEMEALDTETQDTLNTLKQYLA